MEKGFRRGLDFVFRPYMIQKDLSGLLIEVFPVLVPVFQIPFPPWTARPEVLRVLSVLNEPDNPEPLTLLVGGCVRNALLGRAVADYDAATRLLPDQVITWAEHAGLRALPTGIAHGTVTVVCDGVPVQVTTLRRDVETDGRHAVVAFTEDWEADAARRDFTVNTLLSDAAGRVFDPLGLGFSDLQARRVVFVGDPRARIQEDTLRILRFFRFQAEIGQGDPEVEAVAACRDLAAGLSHLSRERVTQEFVKWLSVDNPVDSLKSSFENNVLTVLFQFIPDFDRFARLIELQKQCGERDLTSRLLVFCGGADGVAEFIQKLSLSSFQIKMLKDVSHLKIDMSFGGAEAFDRDLYLSGYSSVLSRLFFDLSAADAPGDAELWIKRLQARRDWGPPTCPITGADLVAAGIPAGPKVGEILKSAEVFWLDHHFTPTRAELLARFVR